MSRSASQTEDAVKEEPMEAQAYVSEVDYDRSELPELLKIYYSRIFPYDKYFDWLQYGERGREDTRYIHNQMY